MYNVQIKDLVQTSIDKMSSPLDLEKGLYKAYESVFGMTSES